MPASPDLNQSASLEELTTLEVLGPRRFQARAHQVNRNGVLYGGQLIAQALAAAVATVEERGPHAMQLFFQGPGNAEQALIYDVEVSREGGSLSTRRVVATQGGAAVAFAMISFRGEDEGYRHEQAWGEPPPAPEALPSLDDLQSRYSAEVSAHGRGRLRCYPQVDVRPIDAQEHLLMRAGAPRCRYWIRARIPASADARRSLPALAFLSDYLLVNAALVPHVTELPLQRLFVASLNHAIWFHAVGDCSDWLLYETHSPWADAAHALIHGRFYSRKGRLLASTAQEALLRPRT